uniref:Uncharacterized protein n=1 Tax=Fagus sylvatica TaxID=28930 RepID=A0A2N9EDH5_FAGSY
MLQPTPLPTTGHHKRERRERGSRSVSGILASLVGFGSGATSICADAPAEKDEATGPAEKETERAETENEEVGDRRRRTRVLENGLRKNFP